MGPCFVWLFMEVHCCTPPVPSHAIWIWNHIQWQKGPEVVQRSKGRVGSMHLWVMCMCRSNLYFIYSLYVYAYTLTTYTNAFTRTLMCPHSGHSFHSFPFFTIHTNSYQGSLRTLRPERKHHATPSSWEWLHNGTQPTKLQLQHF